MKSMLRFKTVNGVRYVHDEIAYRMGTARYWEKGTPIEEQLKIIERAEKNPVMPKQHDSTNNITNKETGMEKELSDEELNRLDVESGAIVDMAHADLMEPLTEACCKLQDTLEVFFVTSRRNQIINKMSVDELNALIASITAMNDKLTALG